MPKTALAARPATLHVAASAPQAVAAVDLGSNSFHMIVGRVDAGLREPVRLAAGLDANKRLTHPVEQRALDCLSRFGQRLRGLPRGTVRAVGTNTLRQLHDGGAFLRAASAALGHPVEVIAGREEARVVYLGVAHGLAAGDEWRLVVDIGGGSTELIIGQRFEPTDRESLHMGCVSISQRFFGDGRITEQAMDSAMLACGLELRPVKAGFRAARWDTAVGSSGTIKSIGEVVRLAGWSDEGITRASLKKLRRALVAAGHVDRLQMAGLTDDRRPVLAGGVAVLSAVFKALGVERMLVSDFALREGLLYELLGHIRHEEDVRDRTVESLMRRYDVDRAQATRVQGMAAALYAQVPGCTRSASPSRTASSTSTAPTSSPTPTCRVSRSSSRRSSPRWCGATVASWRSTSSTPCQRRRASACGGCASCCGLPCCCIAAVPAPCSRGYAWRRPATP